MSTCAALTPMTSPKGTMPVSHGSVALAPGDHVVPPAGGVTGGLDVVTVPRVATAAIR